MAKDSAEINATLPGLPQADRKPASMRMAALSSTAHDLLHATPAAPLERGSLAKLFRKPRP